MTSSNFLSDFLKIPLEEVVNGQDNAILVKNSYWIIINNMVYIHKESNDFSCGKRCHMTGKPLLRWYTTAIPLSNIIFLEKAYIPTSFW